VFTNKIFKESKFDETFFENEVELIEKLLTSSIEKGKIEKYL
jgi:hypothetical protein